MKRLVVIGTCAWVLFTVAASAHVTPTVQLVHRGDFIRSALPTATQFFERKLDNSVIAALTSDTEAGWHPSPREIKVYVGRDKRHRRVGTVIFLRVPSEHGPVGLGVAYDAGGDILQAVVTEVGSEPLAWCRPLIDAHALSELKGNSASQAVDATTLAPQVHGRMSRYYARILAEGVEHAGRILGAAGLTQPDPEM